MKRFSLFLGAALCAPTAPASACSHTGVAAVACPACDAYAAPQAFPVQAAADDCADQQVQQVAVPVQTLATVRVVRRQYVGIPAVRTVPVQTYQQSFAVQQAPVQTYQQSFAVPQVQYQQVQAFPVTATPVFANHGYGYGGGANTFGVRVGVNRFHHQNNFGFRGNGFGVHHGAAVGTFAGNGFGAGLGGGTVNINAKKFKVKRSQLDGLFNSGGNVNINAKKFKVKRSQFN
jgi:hypothetical protein